MNPNGSLKTIIEDIITKRKNPVLVLNIKEITKFVSLNIYHLLQGKKFDELDVILLTPGGDIDAAFVITKILRKKAKILNVIIPLFAKSAGTLICLSADNIIMNDLSELGPLDSQIPEVQDGGNVRYVSALNGFKALEQVQQHTVETLDIVIKLLLERSNIKVSEAISLSTEFSGKTSGTLYSKMDPNKIGEYARALEIGEKYGIIILTRYKEWQQKEAEDVITTLVKKYPSHGFVIDMEELCNLGFPAKMASDTLAEQMVALKDELLKDGLNSDIIQLFDVPSEKKETEKLSPESLEKKEEAINNSNKK
ncbi:MAG: hypothetical protein WC726_04445 [Parcubacteria group bacterium]|jgi:hypothetical protein